MADIHLLPESGESVVYPEERVAELLHHGELSTRTLYWREGMDDWEPLATFRPRENTPPLTEPLPLTATGTARLATATLPSVAADKTGPFQPATAANGRSYTGSSRKRKVYRFRRNPWPLTAALILLLVACLALTGMEMISGLRAMNRLTVDAIPPMTVREALGDLWSSTKTPSGATALAPDSDPTDGTTAVTTAEILQWSGWGAQALLFAVYLWWLYRTVVNCRHFSSIMRLTPGWAVGYYFIPFLNLFHPCQAMQEIWRVSHNPRGWLNDRGSILVGVWWVLTLVTAGVAIESAALFVTMQTRDDEIFAELFFLVLKGIQLAWYATFLLLVSLIVCHQKGVVDRSRRQQETVGAPVRA